MDKDAFLMGQLNEPWMGGNAKSITFCVTEDCNLACKYCYMTGKNKTKKMTLETAKKAVDYILSNKEDFNDNAVVWEFIGGEPFLEIELIDQITDYIKKQLYLLDHPWFTNYRLNFSSNGMLYSTPAVQEYIRKNKEHVSIGLSVDGNKIKHDLQRIKPNGEGSYEDVLKNVPLWLKQFPNASTKATFSHDDLPYLKDSIISLWNNGIKVVAANVVFEDVWEDGDDIILENQLKELGDYVIENKLWDECSVRFFDPYTGHPLSEENLQKNWCGSGRMLAIDCEGTFFPCVRFYDFSLNNREGYKIGDIEKGINSDKLRPFKVLSLESQSKKECIECEVATGCSWCSGFNFDAAETDTLFERATYICKMHKATVRANIYFWDNLYDLEMIVSPRDKYKIKSVSENSKALKKNLIFITSDNIKSHCIYDTENDKKNVMSEEIQEKGLEFAKNNNFVPVYLSEDNNLSSSIDSNNKVISIFNGSKNFTGGNYENSILTIERDTIKYMLSNIKIMFQFGNRINLILKDISMWDEKDINEYKNQLDMVGEYVIGLYRSKNQVELNVLTDLWNLKSMCNCGAGETDLSLAPNGKIYMCPAFYFDNEENYIGSLEEGINIKNENLLSLEKAPICLSCDVYNCMRCKFLNWKLTSQINIPSKIQCTISHIERNKSREIQTLLIKEKLIKVVNRISEIEYLDPLDQIVEYREENINA